MDFRELVYVMAVAEEKNMTKAAEKLFVAQPTLSQTISSVEKKYGLKLFQRHPQGVTLTYAGETFVTYAQRILDVKNELDIEMDRISRLGAGRIRVGIPPFLSSYILPILLPHFSTEFPEVEIEIVEDSSLFLEEQIVRGEIELAIMALPLMNDSLSSEFIFSEKILIVISDKNPLSQIGEERPGMTYRYLAPDSVANQKYVLTPKLSQIRNTAEHFFRANNIRPNIELVTSNIETCCSLAASNVGISIIPEHFASQEGRHPGLTFFETNETMKSWRIGIARMKKKPTDALVDAVADIIVNTLKKDD